MILKENNLQISVDKCQFYKDTINFLAHNIRTEANNRKLKTLTTFQNPQIPNPYVNSWEW